MTSFRYPRYLYMDKYTMQECKFYKIDGLAKSSFTLINKTLICIHVAHENSL